MKLFYDTTELSFSLLRWTEIFIIIQLWGEITFQNWTVEREEFQKSSIRFHDDDCWLNLCLKKEEKAKLHSHKNICDVDVLSPWLYHVEAIYQLLRDSASPPSSAGVSLMRRH